VRSILFLFYLLLIFFSCTFFSLFFYIFLTFYFYSDLACGGRLTQGARRIDPAYRQARRVSLDARGTVGRTPVGRHPSGMDGVPPRQRARPLDGTRCLRLGNPISIRLPRLRAPDDEQNPPDDRNQPEQLKPSATVRVVQPPRRHRDARQEGREGKRRRQSIVDGSENHRPYEREQNPPPKLRSRRTTVKKPHIC